MDSKQFDKKNVNQAVGTVLRQLRNNCGKTQDDLSVDLDIDRRHIGRIESGEKQVSLYMLLKISCALGVKPSAVVALVEEQIYDR